MTDGSKLSIFIDGAYLFKGFTEYGFGTAYRQSLKRLARRISENHYLVRVHYYNAINNRDQALKEKQERFYQGVLRDKFGWNVRILPLQWPGGKAQQKGVDTTLALEMNQLAISNEYETAVLLAADADFVPLVEYVKQCGKVVRNAYYAMRPSWHLQQACNGAPIRLDDIDFIYRATNTQALGTIDDIRAGLF